MAAPFSLTDASVQNLFKHKYEKISMNMYNGANTMLGRVKKSYDSVGDQTERAVPLGFQGGAGFGSLPSANRGYYGKAIFSTKKVYAVCEVDRRTIKQSKNEGAFVEALKENVKKTVEKFNWLMSFALWGDGSGACGVVNAVTALGGANYSFTVTAASYVLARWEIRDFVNFGSSTDNFEITNVVPTTKTVFVTRLSGSYIPVAADVVYLQGSKDVAPQGIRGILDATTGAKYNINIGYRWQSYQRAAAGAGINVDLMNEVMLEAEKLSGITPNLIATSYVQMRKLLNQLEDQKRYFSNGKVSSRYGDFSFNAVEFMSMKGSVPIIVDRFIEDSRMYFLNDDHIEINHAPDTPGWSDDEGFVFLRKSGDDAYDARYASYAEIYIPPTPHGVITGLAV